MRPGELPPELSEEEWLERRKRGLGGSEVAAVAGLSPWATALDVYAAKLGLVERPASLAMRVGSHLEPFVLAQYGEAVGVEVVRLGRRLFGLGGALGFHIGTPDAIVVDGQGVEAKTANVRMADEWGEEGTDQVPTEYLVQAQWYMPILRVEVVDVAVLIGNSDFRVYRVERDDNLIGTLDEIAGRFWRDNVLRGVPPPMDASDAAAEILRKRFPRDEGVVREATPEEEVLISTYRIARAALEQFGRDVESLANRIKDAIGKDAGLASRLGTVTWRKSRDGEKVDWRQVALDLKPDPKRLAKLVKKNSTTKEGARRFLARLNGEEE